MASRKVCSALPEGALGLLVGKASPRRIIPNEVWWVIDINQMEVGVGS